MANTGPNVNPAEDVASFAPAQPTKKSLTPVESAVSSVPDERSELTRSAPSVPTQSTGTVEATLAEIAEFIEPAGSFQQETIRIRDESSPAFPADEPLSTEALPIPSPPVATEAEDALQQVFDVIEAAPRDDNFSDSGYSESLVQSGSTSLSSSVRDFEFENGRRYHAFRSGKYLLPNDELEAEREDMKHTTVLTVCGEKLFFSGVDLDRPHQTRVLDLGTGTGIWCVDMGDKYPSAEVIGIDLSPHQPDWVPPNVRFQVDDFESEWLFPDNHFDMIHGRHISLAIKDWDHVLSSSMAALKPGGFLEFCEFDYWPNSDDGTMASDNGHLHWTHLVTEGLARVGVDLHAAIPLKNRVIQAGFENVVEHVIKVPIGQWPLNPLLRKVGMYMHAVLYDGLQGIALGPLTRGLGWTKEEVELLLPRVRKDISDISIHTYYSLHVVYGSKPHQR